MGKSDEEEKMVEEELCACGSCVPTRMANEGVEIVSAYSTQTKPRAVAEAGG